MRRTQAIAVLRDLINSGSQMNPGRCKYIYLSQKHSSESAEEAFEVHFRITLDKLSKATAQNIVASHGLKINLENDDTMVIS